MQDTNREAWTNGTAVLITGASRGIGRATALYLARAGLSVFAGVRRPPDGASVEAEGEGRVRGVLLDVTDDDSIASARDEVDRVVGPAGLGGLVNNAAAGFGGPLEHVTRPDLEQLFGVNFHGVVLVTSAFLPLLRRAGGRIVNVGGGGAGCLAIPLMGVGCASKYAIEGMTDALRLELRKVGIKVSLIEPGMTYSDADEAGSRQEELATTPGLRSRISAPPSSDRCVPARPLAERRRSFLSGHNEFPRRSDDRTRCSTARCGRRESRFRRRVRAHRPDWRALGG